MEESTKDWLDYTADKVYENYQGRKVVLWGKYSASEELGLRLKEKYQVEIAFYIDGNKEKMDNRSVFSVDTVRAGSSEYYIVILLAVYDSIKGFLAQENYKPDQDYFYFSDCALREEPDYYEDAHGNKIIGRYEGLKFAFSGFGSVVEVGGVKFSNTVVYLHNDSHITIGGGSELENANICLSNGAKMELADDCKLQSCYFRMKENAFFSVGLNSSFSFLKTEMEEHVNILINKDVTVHDNYWFLGGRSKLLIGESGKLSVGEVYLESNARLEIGRDFTVEHNYKIILEEDSAIAIGDDCMFSWDVIVRNSDGHSIFDVRTGKNINSTYAIRKERKVVIGNHVWVGVRSIILYNTRIEDGSIIGAGSLVKCHVPNNCIAAGNPARIIRRDVAWSRENGREDIQECGLDYIHLTGENKGITDVFLNEPERCV